MGMELYIALAIRALLHLDPEMMKNIPFDAVHHSPMQRHNELGDLIADLLDFRIVILHSGGGQFKSGNKGRDLCAPREIEPLHSVDMSYIERIKF